MNKERYVIDLTVVDCENTVSAKRDCVYLDEDGQASFGWCMGSDIADAILSVGAYISPKCLDDLFEAIEMRKNDHDDDTATITGKEDTSE